ncbi:AMP-binding protein [Mycobacterium avium]|uniref:AMP-binding protein n=2 Tax=Mycobacterium avium TaxID=1764 RepID=UPI00044D3532|nr:AMP-binding protein [Mycobacterium avium]APA78299.1 AMP-binding protein [Mycobacterium avium subsp. hominissuis]ETZ43633.1 AMP-binding enzyme family protein [Mycobacterium avium MAV_061107_1842]MBZ4535618.1 AMP-binding protein [Mycobacterium avium subsp. hominissuis]MBZ4578644.1 AMP-binding protein [Mycobacterium avium subsp. hominissuis]MBZ4592591.1 AMP-binding protein [Mycobacterium avium subsp. hominissuis]
MSAERVAPTAARALVRSGLLNPPSPRAVLRLLREASRGGTNPYTLLAVTAARWPGRTAIIDDDGALSYRELQRATESLARRLTRDGVAPGRAVGVMCRNGRGFVTAVFAVALLGADVVPISTEFRSDALAAALRAHHISTVVADNEFAERIAAADDAVAVIDPATAGAEESGGRPAVAAPGRIVLLTSGTTGKPKGVPRAPQLRSAVGVWVTILDRTRLRTGSRISVAMPMFHGLGLGMLMLTIALGGTVLTHRHFDAEAALAQASLHRADAFTAVPVVLARILELPPRVRARNPLPQLRVVMSSGDRLDPTLGQRFMDTYGDILYNGYGSTEVGIGALATPADLRDAPETVGKPVAGCPVRILDRNNRPVGPRVTGRIFVGGELAGTRYTDGGRKTVVDGMTSTGDMGYLDNAGRLFIVGREDDMIISGGENVYPRAVENALAAHPAVADNAVIGVPDERFGHRLAAFVVLHPGSGVDAAQLRDYLKDRVSRFEQPRDINIVASIPRNPTGKVLRKELPG